MSKLQTVARNFKREFEVYRAVLRHPQTPRRAKVLLSAAIGYALLPFDIIPDFIPIIGHLDDAIIVPSLVWMALQWVPAEIVSQCREEVEAKDQKPVIDTITVPDALN